MKTLSEQYEQMYTETQENPEVLWDALNRDIQETLMSLGDPDYQLVLLDALRGTLIEVRKTYGGSDEIESDTDEYMTAKDGM